ncbi:beta-phosphoglucomutase [Hordeum vulgare]|nr:beta-phosphoglucomutase [Hordeum vulgare]
MRLIERLTEGLILCTQALSRKASLTTYFFRLEYAKIRGAISIVFFPLNQGVSQKGVFPPFPMAGVAAGMPVVAIASESREAKVVAAGASMIARDYRDAKLWAALDADAVAPKIDSELIAVEPHVSFPSRIE